MLARLLKSCLGGHRAARAGDACHPHARGEFCIVHNGKVAMPAWKLKRSLQGGRMDVPVSMRFPCMLYNDNVAIAAWELKGTLNGVGLHFLANLFFRASPR